jgi:hypothetical protein
MPMVKHKHSQTKREKKLGFNKTKLGTISDRQILKVAKMLYAVHDIRGEVPHGMDEELFTSLMKNSCSYYHTLVRQRGVDKGTKRFVEVRRYFTSYLIYGKALVPDCLSCTKRGYPRDFNYLKRFAKVKNIKILSTILNVTRLSEVGNSLCPNFNSVRSGLSINPKEVIAEFEKDIPSIIERLRINKTSVSDLEFKWEDAQSKGPNSSLTKKNSLASSFVDIYSLSKDKPLFNAIKNTLNLSGNFGIISLFAKYLKIAENTLSDFEKNNSWHSKLVKIPCPENKTRTVAILDYWSQLVLKMFLPIIDRAENQIMNSFMFDQDSGRERVKDFTLNRNPVSLDGKDFTDRFHFKLQEIVMRNLVEEQDAVRWFFHILRGRGFVTKTNQRLTWYKIGQPMGANCSFQLANLTHCLFAIWCCEKATIERHGKSEPLSEIMKLTAVCGDDIVFAYKYHAEHYRKKMQAIGLQFSESKGYVSKDGIKIAEFCKRTYLAGENISGFSPRPASNFMNNDKHVFSINRAYELTDEQVYQIVDNLKPKRSKNIIELKNLYNIFHNGISALYTDVKLCETALQAKDHIERGRRSTKELEFNLLLKYLILKEVQQRAFYLNDPMRRIDVKKMSLHGFVDYRTYQTYEHIVNMDDPLLGTISDAHIVADPDNSANTLLNPLGQVKAERSARANNFTAGKLLVYSDYDIYSLLAPFKNTMLEKEVNLDFLQRNSDFSSKHYNSVRFWFARTTKDCLDMGRYDLG